MYRWIILIAIGGLSFQYADTGSDSIFRSIVLPLSVAGVVVTALLALWGEYLPARDEEDDLDGYPEGSVERAKRERRLLGRFITRKAKSIESKGGADAITRQDRVDMIEPGPDDRYDDYY